MKSFKNFARVSFTILLFCGFPFPLARSATGADAQPAGLLKNGTFSQVDADGWPADWPKGDGITAQSEDGFHFLRFTSPMPGKMVMAYRRLYLPNPAPPGLEMRLKTRYAIKVGAKSWFDARVLLHFKDAGDAVINPDPPTLAFHGESKEWVTKSVFFAIPKDAEYLEIMPCLFQVSSGSLDVAACEIFPATAEQLPKPPPMIPSTTRALPDLATLPPELHVAGNQLRTATGKVVWLQGLCLDSLEWAARGEHLPGSIAVAIDGWHANVIRLPVKSAFWWGFEKHQKDAGMAYRKLIDACIDDANQRGAYVALDLHRFGAMTEEDSAFWKDAANRYKNNPGVLFELFNEPHSLSWKAWRYGGSLKEDAHQDVNVAENSSKSAAGATIGMQALLDAVRAVGARNLAIAGGLDWGYDLSGVVNGFALSDKPDADGVMYSSHIYPWKKNWQHYTLDAAAKFPVFIGEVGCPQDWSAFKFIPQSQRLEELGPNCTWPGDMLGTIQKYKLNWTGFSFHPKCGPEAISDWNYTPTPYWGTFVKDALSGKIFPVQRMR